MKIAVRATKPFASGTWRGLEAEPHGCHPQYVFSISAKSTPEGRQEWADFFGTMKDHLSEEEECDG